MSILDLLILLLFVNNLGKFLVFFSPEFYFILFFLSSFFLQF